MGFARVQPCSRRFTDRNAIDSASAHRVDLRAGRDRNRCRCSRSDRACFRSRLDASNMAGSSVERAMSSDGREMLSGVGQPGRTSPLVRALPPWLLVDCYVVRDLASLPPAPIVFRSLAWTCCSVAFRRPIPRVARRAKHATCWSRDGVVNIPIDRIRCFG